MPSKTYTIKEITNYLLEALPDAEADRLEQAYFEDPGLAITVSEVENNLIDDYVRGQLSSREQELFENHYLLHPSRRRRVENARALLLKFDQLKIPSSPMPEKSSWWQSLLERMQTRPLVFATTALTALLAVGGSLYLWAQYNKSRQQATALQIAQSTNQQRSPETTPQPSSERYGKEPLAKEAAGSQSQPSTPPARSINIPSIPTVTLRTGASRREQRTPEAPSQPQVVTSENKKIRLVLNTKATDYQSYIAQIWTDAEPGEKIFAPTSRIKPSRQHGVETLMIIIPTTSLKSGVFDYRLKLTGITSTGEEPVPSISFRLEKR